MHTWSVLTERPIHLLDSDSHRLHLGSPGSYPLGRLLSVLDAICELPKLMYVGLIFSVPEVSFVLDSFSFEVLICGSLGKHNAAPKKQSAKMNSAVFIFMRESNLSICVSAN